MRRDFRRPTKRARAALLRVRPRLVVIDCDHEDACSEAFIGPALMTGSQVLLFRSRRTRRDVSELADRLGLRTVGDAATSTSRSTSLLHELRAVAARDSRERDGPPRALRVRALRVARVAVAADPIGRRGLAEVLEQEARAALRALTVRRPSTAASRDPGCAAARSR